MKVLKFSKKLFELSGILVAADDTASASKKTVLKNIFFICCLTLLLYPINSIISHHNEIEKAANAILLTCAGFMSTGKYCFLRKNRRIIRDLIDSFQTLVDDKSKVQ